jgi:hypothetical protein
MSVEPRALRTLRIGTEEYKYRVHTRVTPDSTIFSAFHADSPRTPVRFVFHATTEHGSTFPHQDGVVHDYREPSWNLNLHLPRTAEFLIRLARDSGWNPERGRNEFMIDNAYDFLRERLDAMKDIVNR